MVVEVAASNFFCNQRSIVAQLDLFTKQLLVNKNSTTGADASGELMQLAEELANCNAVVCN